MNRAERRRRTKVVKAARRRLARRYRPTARDTWAKQHPLDCGHPQCVTCHGTAKDAAARERRLLAKAAADDPDTQTPP